MRVFLTFVRSLRDQLHDPVFRAAFGILTGLVAIGTLVYSAVEGWSLLDSLYFCVMTAATVGFGDLAPRTDLGKAFTIVYVLIGVGLLVLVLSRLASGMVELRLAKAAQRGARAGERDTGTRPAQRRPAQRPTQPSDPT